MTKMKKKNKTNQNPNGCNKKPIAPHVVHLDCCKIIAMVYKLNEMAIGEIVENDSPRTSDKYKFQSVISMLPVLSSSKSNQ